MVLWYNQDSKQLVMYLENLRECHHNFCDTYM